MSNTQPAASNPIGFPNTSWSCIQAMRQGSEPERKAAVQRFTLLYWKPVFYYLRAKGLPVDRAEDLAHDFLVRILEKGETVVKTADAQRGRFRDFLRGVLDHFLADQGAHRARRQLAFEQQHLSIQGLIGDEELSYEPATGETPEAVFDRRWAASLWDHVLHQLRAQYASEDRETWLTLFLAYQASASKRPSQEALAEQFGLSRDHVRDILHKVQQRIDRLVRAELREQLGPAVDLEDEVRELGRLLDGATSC